VCIWASVSVRAEAVDFFVELCVDKVYMVMTYLYIDEESRHCRFVHKITVHKY
jgi:hypothetical protein